jgi:hypothetical protein
VKAKRVRLQMVSEITPFTISHQGDPDIQEKEEEANSFLILSFPYAA